MNTIIITLAIFISTTIAAVVIGARYFVDSDDSDAYTSAKVAPSCVFYRVSDHGARLLGLLDDESRSLSIGEIKAVLMSLNDYGIGFGESLIESNGRLFLVGTHNRAACIASRQ